MSSLSNLNARRPVTGHATTTLYGHLLARRPIACGDPDVQLYEIVFRVARELQARAVLGNTALHAEAFFAAERLFDALEAYRDPAEGNDDDEGPEVTV